MKEMRHKFWSVLFDPKDKIAWGVESKTCNKPRNPNQGFLTTQDNMFCINPLDEWRNMDNVTAFNSLLFECDDKSLTPKEQAKKFIETGLPFSTMTFSGKKSIHVIVRLTEPMPDRYWHTSWWNAIDKVLKQYGITSDPAAALSVQISRLPGSIRRIPILNDDGNKTGEYEKEQTSIFIRSRVEQHQIKEWLAKHNVEIQEPKQPEKSDYNPNLNESIDDSEKWQQAIDWHAEKHGQYNPTATTGNHIWLLHFGSKCYQVNLSMNAMLSYATEFGQQYITSGGKNSVDKVLAKGWTNAKEKSYKQYTLDKKARQEYYRKQEAEMRELLEKKHKYYGTTK